MVKIVIKYNLSDEMVLVYPECPYASEDEERPHPLDTHCEHKNKEWIYCATHHRIPEFGCPFNIHVELQGIS